MKKQDPSIADEFVCNSCSQYSLEMLALKPIVYKICVVKMELISRLHRPGKNVCAIIFTPKLADSVVSNL